MSDTNGIPAEKLWKLKHQHEIPWSTIAGWAHVQPRTVRRWIYESKSVPADRWELISAKLKSTPPQ